MVMSWVWMGLIGLSIGASLLFGTGQAVTNAALEGAQAGVNLAISMAGAICLWSGVGKAMEKAGISGLLARILKPVLFRIFPSCKKDPVLAGNLSANVCANILGLGNAATPMGIQAAQQLAKYGKPGIAGNELCRLVVLNTASIQLIPSNVAAIRASMGCQTPFDILPAVWLTSLCAAGLGLGAAWILGRIYD